MSPQQGNSFKYLIVCLLVWGLSGCSQRVQIDAEPVAPMGGARFSATENACRALILSASVLPLDIYHMGLCYEQGLSVASSTAQAIALYQEAARWGVPEAKVALQRLHQPVPEAELRQRQEQIGNQIRRERDDSVYRQLEQERSRLLHDSRYRTRCGLHWCY